MARRTWVFAGAIAVLVAAGAGYFGWRHLHAQDDPDWIVKSNGRLEGEQVMITSKLPGRLVAVLAEEGQMVDAGAVLARLDSTEIDAQLQAAQAQIHRAEQAVAEAQQALALRASVRTFALQELDRTKALQVKGFATGELLDRRQSEVDAAEAAYQAGVASLGQANASLDAARADVARLQSVLNDTILKAPLRGRVQYKLMQAGEVAAAGSRVLTLLDLTDVYMTIFLPADAAAHLAMGDEARLVLDPIPQYVVPAEVSFVAADAQFTPKSVETADEREKLMFRVKLTIAPELLRRFESQVKTGVRGIGYVRTRRDLPWPASLQTKLPQ